MSCLDFPHSKLGLGECQNFFVSRKAIDSASLTDALLARHAIFPPQKSVCEEPTMPVFFFFLFLFCFVFVVFFFLCLQIFSQTGEAR